jgi:hypothetical protein
MSLVTAGRGNWEGEAVRDLPSLYSMALSLPQSAVLIFNFKCPYILLIPVSLASLIFTGQGCLNLQKVKFNNGITRALPSKNLEADFLNPPDYAKIRSYCWWLNSNVTKRGSDPFSRDQNLFR